MQGWCPLGMASSLKTDNIATVTLGTDIHATIFFKQASHGLWHLAGIWGDCLENTVQEGWNVQGILWGNIQGDFVQVKFSEKSGSPHRITSVHRG